MMTSSISSSSNLHSSLSSTLSSSDPADFATFLPPKTRETLAQLNQEAESCARLDTKKQHLSPDNQSIFGFSVKTGSVAQIWGCPEWNQSWFGHLVRPWPKEPKLAATCQKLVSMTHAPNQKFSELPIVIDSQRQSQLTQIDDHLQNQFTSAVLQPSRFFQFPPHIEAHNNAVNIFEKPLTHWMKNQRNKPVTDDLSTNQLLDKLQKLGAKEPLGVEIIRACLSRADGLISGPHFRRYFNKIKEDWKYRNLRENLTTTEFTAFENYLDTLKEEVERRVSTTPERDYPLIKEFLSSDVTKEIKLRKLIHYMSDFMEVAHTIGINFIDEIKKLQTDNPKTPLSDLVKQYNKPQKNYYLQAYELCTKLLEDNYNSWKEEKAFPKLKAAFETWVKNQREYCGLANRELGKISKHARTTKDVKKRMGDQEFTVQSIIMDKELLKLFAYVDMPAQLEDTDDDEWIDEEEGGIVSMTEGIRVKDEEAIFNVSAGVRVENEGDADNSDQRKILHLSS